jgi:hypothetical protein
MNHHLNFLCFFLLEGITYVLVYKTEKYKKLKAEVEKDSKKCKLMIISRVPQKDFKYMNPVTILFINLLFERIFVVKTIFYIFLFLCV